MSDLMAIGLLVAFALIGWGIIREAHDPHSYHELYRLLRQTTNDAARTTVELIEARGLLREYEEGHRLNARRMQLRRVEPAWVPTRTAASVTNGGSLLVPLYDLLYERFSGDELYDLAFRIGLSGDDIGGETHAAKARYVVEYADDRNIVASLINVGMQKRPELAWPDIQEDL